MIDAVLSYHADPISCGVTKFSQQLAKRLDVGWGTLGTTRINHVDVHHSLVSVKFAELGERPMLFLQPYDLFLHDYQPGGWRQVLDARRVFAASRAIADQVRGMRPDVIPAWCPSLVEAQAREPITVLSFGMAHKLRADLYETLKEKLDATGENYVVYVSAALHDGTTFGDASASFETLRRLFGPRFVFLGTLSDEAMVDRLRTCTYVAAFFEKGLRENNTSVMAAIEHGAIVLTNHDHLTPAPLTALSRDIRTDELPHRDRADMLKHFYGWDKLVELIRAA